MSMQRLILEHLPHIPVRRQQIELVERKGVGHPDSMCDAIMEAISVAISQAYIAATGRVLHHNIDKGLLVAGQTSPALGGGTVNAPMRLIVGDRLCTVPCPSGSSLGQALVSHTAARRLSTPQALWLCRRFCSWGHEGQVAPRGRHRAPSTPIAHW